MCQWRKCFLCPRYRAAGAGKKCLDLRGTRDFDFPLLRGASVGNGYIWRGKQRVRPLRMELVRVWFAAALEDSPTSTFTSMLAARQTEFRRGGKLCIYW